MPLNGFSQTGSYLICFIQFDFYAMQFFFILQSDFILQRFLGCSVVVGWWLEGEIVKAEQEHGGGRVDSGVHAGRVPAQVWMETEIYEFPWRKKQTRSKARRIENVSCIHWSGALKTRGGEFYSFANREFITKLRIFNPSASNGLFFPHWKLYR